MAGSIRLQFSEQENRLFGLLRNLHFTPGYNDHIERMIVSCCLMDFLRTESTPTIRSYDEFSRVFGVRIDFPQHPTQPNVTRIGFLHINNPSQPQGFLFVFPQTAGEQRKKLLRFIPLDSFLEQNGEKLVSIWAPRFLLRSAKPGLSLAGMASHIKSSVAPTESPAKPAAAVNKDGALIVAKM